MKYWIWLTEIPYVGCITVNRLLVHFGTPRAVYEAAAEELSVLEGLTGRQCRSILAARSLAAAEKTLDICDRKAVSILTKADAAYPDRALGLRDAPAVLYYQGRIREMPRTVGTVGARRCSQKAKSACYRLTEGYLAENRVIISGMAKGIDACAHTLCLQRGGYTVAVLGNGLDICYPTEHKHLMEAIRENGLLLSEYPPGTTPSVYTFPRRNRLIAAWSEELQVIAAGKGSGARITAAFAEQYGRTVTWHAECDR